MPRSLSQIDHDISLLVDHYLHSSMTYETYRKNRTSLDNELRSARKAPYIPPPPVPLGEVFISPEPPPLSLPEPQQETSHATGPLGTPLDNPS